LHRLAYKIMKVAMLSVLAASPVVIYAALTAGHRATLAACLVIAQLTFIMAAMLAVTVARYTWLALAAGGAILTFVILQRPTEQDILALSGAPHAIAYLTLLAIFGISQIRPREAVITILARRVRPMPDDVVAYTRAVNLAWCFFFVGQLAASLLLWLYAPKATWLFFINILNFPLIALMFFAEYGYRLYRLRHHPRDKLSHIWRMFTPRKKDGPDKATTLTN